ncbi:uncharacterized protein LOC122650502 [Telopea speciosissima]|uniref:uncharacterized protein LOC122650502 n=1 Tax=Telopea speciosissima TaxID=54955 RepID=UPI001CC39F46|nr:uncharacterized protein LOC122650502 [Telopea speciosissima]
MPPPEDDDEDALSLQEQTEERLCNTDNHRLVGQIMFCKPYRCQAISEALVQAWNPRFPVVITPMQENRYCFQFQHKLDLLNVLDEGPWAVRGNLLLLEHWNENQEWGFQSTDFWVQIHEVPLELFNLEVASQLAAKVGQPKQVILVQGFQFGAKVRYVRARVHISIVKPLRQSITVKRRSKNSSTVLLRYERLPSFCYFCGLFDHEVKRCVLFSMLNISTAWSMDAQRRQAVPPSLTSDMVLH